jgi:uncharacterized protein (TIGR03435 family)
MHVRRILLLATTLATPLALAQTATAPLTYDVISIRPASSGTSTDNRGVTKVMMTSRAMPDGISLENMNAMSLIGTAYGVKPDSIVGGPDWINSNHYDINAKVTPTGNVTPPALTDAQRKQMLQSLLADRFKLAVHPETKEGSIYELDFAKGGSKLHEFTPSDTSQAVTSPDGRPVPRTRMVIGSGQLSGKAIPISSLVEMLSNQLHRPVVDKTGLTGKYDIDLHWTPDSLSASQAPPADASGPDIFTALQEQLGLKLNPAKAPVETLIIDHIEPPSEN